MATFSVYSSSFSMPSSRQDHRYWDAAQVLGVDPDCSGFTCVGYAPSMGRRCRNPVNQFNRAKASRLLDEMSKQRPKSEAVELLLEELAPTVLCIRNHQGQASKMFTQWLYLAYEARVTRREPRVNTTEAATFTASRSALAPRQTNFQRREPERERYTRIIEASVPYSRQPTATTSRRSVANSQSSTNDSPPVSRVDSLSSGYSADSRRSERSNRGDRQPQDLPELTRARLNTTSRSRVELGGSVQGERSPAPISASASVLVSTQTESDVQTELDIVNREQASLVAETTSSATQTEPERSLAQPRVTFTLSTITEIYSSYSTLSFGGPLNEHPSTEDDSAVPSESQITNQHPSTEDDSAVLSESQITMPGPVAIGEAEAVRAEELAPAPPAIDNDSTESENDEGIENRSTGSENELEIHENSSIASGIAEDDVADSDTASENEDIILENGSIGSEIEDESADTEDHSLRSENDETDTEQHSSESETGGAAGHDSSLDSEIDNPDSENLSTESGIGDVSASENSPVAEQETISLFGDASENDPENFHPPPPAEGNLLPGNTDNSSSSRTSSSISSIQVYAPQQLYPTNEQQELLRQQFVAANESGTLQELVDELAATAPHVTWYLSEETREAAQTLGIELPRTPERSDEDDAGALYGEGEGDAGTQEAAAETVSSYGVHRRPHDGDCPICRESLLLSGSLLVWCQAQCGQNFHEECMTRWFEVAPQSHVGRKCVYCRGPWIGREGEGEVESDDSDVLYW